ncbi:MAG: hypothetical protein KGJ36_03770 [Acidobacteriota bacterium]|nr:hypothetical protein [Acidobacteriota bacterium]
MAQVILASALVGVGVASGAARQQQPLLLARVPNSPIVYMVTEGPCASAACLHLFRTTVNAASFTTESLPPVSLSSGALTGTLDRLVFATTTTGFALLSAGTSPRLYATHDGGRTWSRWMLRIPGVAQSMAASSTTVYLEMAFCSVTVPSCDNYRIARSPIAGAHWTSTAIPHSPSARGTLFGPLAASASSAWLTETGTRTFLARSRDAGRHFTLVPAPQLVSVAGCALTATSPSSLWAQCPTGMLEALWFSGDDGGSWTYLNTPRTLSGTGGGFFDPVSASLAYVAGGLSFPSLVRFTDAARRVTRVGALSCPNLLGLAFTDVDHGLAVCSEYSTSYLEVTADGGASWRHVAVLAPA